MSDTSPRITVSVHGPYLVSGGIPVEDPEGRRLEPKKRELYALCRCGGSQSKPFCDGTHKRKGFDGTEVADRGPISTRRAAYRGNGITVFDDRSVCSHAGYCTDLLAAVFRSGRKPWIDPEGAPIEDVIAAVRRCPSGALAYGLGDATEPVVEPEAARIVASRDGPYRVSGGVEIVSADEAPFEARPRYTLCRCGGSKNKPFCDGTHWYIGFKA